MSIWQLMQRGKSQIEIENAKEDEEIRNADEERRKEYFEDDETEFNAVQKLYGQSPLVASSMTFCVTSPHMPGQLTSPSTTNIHFYEIPREAGLESEFNLPSVPQEPQCLTPPHLTESPVKNQGSQREFNLSSLSTLKDDTAYEDPIFSTGQTMIVSALIVLFLFYQTIIDMCGQMLQCETLDNGGFGTIKVLIADRSINCDTPEHQRYQAIAILVMLLIGIGLPIFSILIVKLVARVSFGNDMDQARGLFFFVTGGFTERRWYWESIVMIRKALIVLITVAIADVRLRNYLAMWTLLLLFVLNVNLLPYAEPDLSKLEMIGLLTNVISLNLGALFEFYTEEDCGMYYTVTTTIFVVNLACLCIFAWMLLKGIRSKLRALYETDREKFAFLGSFFNSEESASAEDIEKRIFLLREKIDRAKRSLKSTRRPRTFAVEDAIRELREICAEAEPHDKNLAAIERYWWVADNAVMRGRLGEFGEQDLRALFLAETEVITALYEKRHREYLFCQYHTAAKADLLSSVTLEFVEPPPREVTGRSLIRIVVPSEQEEARQN